MKEIQRTAVGCTQLTEYRIVNHFFSAIIPVSATYPVKFTVGVLLSLKQHGIETVSLIPGKK
jgi:hypothetical protein